jgi:hypothetical protein
MEEYIHMEKFCSDLRELSRLEKLMESVSATETSVIKTYQVKHNQLMDSIQTYLAQHYSGEPSLAPVFDIWQYMEAQRVRSEADFERSIAAERTEGKHELNSILSTIEELVATLKKYSEDHS